MNSIKNMIVNHIYYIFSINIVFPFLILFIMYGTRIDKNIVFIGIFIHSFYSVYKIFNIFLKLKRFNSIINHKCINKDLLNQSFYFSNQYILLDNYIFDMKKFKVIEYIDISIIERKKRIVLINNRLAYGDIINIKTENDSTQLITKLYGKAGRLYNVFEELDTFLINKNPKIVYIKIDKKNYSNIL